MSFDNYLQKHQRNFVLVLLLQFVSFHSLSRDHHILNISIINESDHRTCTTKIYPLLRSSARYNRPRKAEISQTSVFDTWQSNFSSGYFSTGSIFTDKNRYAWNFWGGSVIPLTCLTTVADSLSVFLSSTILSSAISSTFLSTNFSSLSTSSQSS